MYEREVIGIRLIYNFFQHQINLSLNVTCTNARLQAAGENRDH